MKNIELEKITKELEKQGFDSISYSKENAIVIFIGEYKYYVEEYIRNGYYDTVLCFEQTNECYID